MRIVDTLGDDGYMQQKYIEELIQRMSTKEDRLTSSDQSIRWKAYREAETLRNPIFYPLLKEYILLRKKPNDRQYRDSAYFILGKLLIHAPQSSYITFYLECLERETDKYILSSMLDRIADLIIPESLSIKPIISLAFSDQRLIRHSAIRALGASETPESKEALAYYLNQEDEKTYKYEIIYANAAFSVIGTLKDIPLLEQHGNSKSRDVRESAISAIKAIKERAK